MNIKKFPNPQLNLPKEFRDSTDEHLNTSFDAIEEYLNSVGVYIYTNINLDYRTSDPRHFHAWVQRLISSNVLRSLYIRNAFVDAFNTRNTVSIFFPLKAWLETAAVLAALLDLLESELAPEELSNKLALYVLGNKGKGALRIGSIEAINVQTMIEKGDKYLKKMVAQSETKFFGREPDQFFTDFYDVVSNPSHPSFDAYEIIGALRDGGSWHAKSPDEVKGMIVLDLNYYGPLLMTPIFIKSLCKKLFEIEAEHNNILGSQRYFDLE